MPLHVVLLVISYSLLTINALGTNATEKAPTDDGLDKSQLILGCFAGFVGVLVCSHCYLKKQQILMIENRGEKEILMKV